MNWPAFTAPLLRAASVSSRRAFVVPSIRPCYGPATSFARRLPHKVFVHNARVAATASEVTLSSPVAVNTDMNIDSDTLLRNKGYKSGDLVLLFDGVCVLCNAGVDFVLQHDTSKTMKFAALQSDVGQLLLDKFNAPKDLSTVVLIQDNKAYTKSEAVLRVGQYLNWYFAVPATLAHVALPKPVRDLFYSNVVAKNRYDWFGEKEECRLVDDENRSRFIL